MSAASSQPRIWRVPIVIGILSLAFLIVALLDDGIWDMIASTVLAAILVWATWKGVVTKG